MGDKSKHVISMSDVMGKNLACGITVFLKIGSREIEKPRSPIIGYELEKEIQRKHRAKAKNESPAFLSLAYSKNLRVNGTTNTKLYKLKMPLYNRVKNSNISVKIYHQSPKFGVIFSNRITDQYHDLRKSASG